MNNQLRGRLNVPCFRLLTAIKLFLCVDSCPSLSSVLIHEGDAIDILANDVNLFQPSTGGRNMSKAELAMQKRNANWDGCK